MVAANKNANNALISLIVFLFRLILKLFFVRGYANGYKCGIACLTQEYLHFAKIKLFLI
jgi:hypothetical protein